MVQHGLSAGTVAAIAKQLLKEVRGQDRWKRAVILDKLQFDVFQLVLPEDQAAVLDVFPQQHGALPAFLLAQHGAGSVHRADVSRRSREVRVGDPLRLSADGWPCRKVHGSGRQGHDARVLHGDQPAAVSGVRGEGGTAGVQAIELRGACVNSPGWPIRSRSRRSWPTNSTCIWKRRPRRSGRRSS